MKRFPSIGKLKRTPSSDSLSETDYERNVKNFRGFSKELKQMFKKLKSFEDPHLHSIFVPLNGFIRFYEEEPYAKKLSLLKTRFDQLLSTLMEENKTNLLEMSLYMKQIKNVKKKIQENEQLKSKLLKSRIKHNTMTQQLSSDANAGNNDLKLKVAKSLSKLRDLEDTYEKGQSNIEDELSLVLANRFRDCMKYYEMWMKLQISLFFRNV